MTGPVVSNPAPVPTVIYSGVQVHNAAAPSAGFTDKNLSAVVGTNRAFALLKIKNDDALAIAYYSLRPNGDADNPTSGTHLTKLVSIDAGAVAFTIVATDATGIIEWVASANNNTRMTVVGYWKAAS